MTNSVARTVMLAIAAAAMLPGAVATAQGFSPGYTFLKAVRDRDGAKATEMASEPGSIVIDSRDLKTGEGGLHITVKRRDATWTNFLLGQGARADLKDNEGNTPLITSAAMGFSEGAQLLIGRGAKVNAANARGETALILAVQNRDVAIVRLLMQSGANPAITDNVTGMNAKDYAARDPRAAAIVRILEAEAAPRAKPMGPSL